jgi:uncharacterized protein with HEPN domain
LSEETKTEHSNIPWRDIIGMRFCLKHAYVDINLDILWKPVIDGLPPLLDDINRALQEET